MSDPLATALARLAPTVDLGASRELFERARDGGAESVPTSPRHHRWMLAAACVVLLVAGLAGVWAIAGRDDVAPAGRPTVAAPGDGTEFDLIAVEPVADPDARSIRAAGTYDDLVSIVSRFGPSFAPFAQDVDFDTQIALVFERIGGFTPDALVRFEPRGDEWVAVWREPGGDTEDVGIGYAYLVTLDRSALAGIARLVTPAEQHGSVTWEALRTPVPGATPDPAISVEEGGRDQGVQDDRDRGTDHDGTVLLIDEVPARFGVVIVATDSATYEAMWTQLATTATPRYVDFARDIVVAFVVPDDACPPEFDGFAIEDGPGGNVWTPVLRETSTACRLPLTSRLILVAVGRAQLGDGVTFRLPADEVHGYDEQTVTIDPDRPAVRSFDWGCAGPTRSSFTMSFDLFDATELIIDVLDGDASLGRGTLSSSQAGPFTIEFGLGAPPSPTAEAIVTDTETGAEIARFPLSSRPVPTCP